MLGNDGERREEDIRIYRKYEKGEKEGTHDNLWKKQKTG